jgi:LPS-assembly protein
MFLGLSLLCPDAVLSASDRSISKGPVDIEADTFTYDRDTDTYIAEGRVVITFSDGILKADKVVLNRSTNNALANGHVSLKSNDDTLEGDSVNLNIESKTGTVYKGSIFYSEQNLYVKGSEIEKKGDQTYSIKDGTATTCDGQCPDWRFTGRELDVTIDGYGKVKDGTFDIKDIPVLYLPYFIFPAKTTRQTGLLLPHFGYSNDRLGFDVALPFFWAVSKSTDATFYQRYMEKRGYQQGVELRYALSPGTFGTFYGDYLKDKWTGVETVGDVTRNWQEKEDRWSYYINTDTTFSPGFYLKTDIKRVSDNYYFRDFSSYNYYQQNYGSTENRRFERVSFVGDESLRSLESTARLVKEWQLYNVSAFAQYTDDFTVPSNDAVLQKYPEIVFTAIRQPVFNTRLNFEGTGAYDYYYRADGEKGHITDIVPKLSLPWSFGDYLQVTPEVSFRETYWNTEGALTGREKKDAGRQLTTFALSLSTEPSRVFDVNGETIDKIKHSVKPELIYSYAWIMNDPDRPDFAPVVEGAHTIAWALTNTLISKLKSKDGKISYQEFLRFKLNQIFDIREQTEHRGDPAKEKRPFGPINWEMDFNPIRYVGYHTEGSFDMNSGTWTKNNHIVALTDPRGDSVAIQYRYTQNLADEINAGLKAVVTNSVDFFYRMRRNQMDHVDLEDTYGLYYHRQCWGVEVSYSNLVSDRTFTVMFFLYGLGKSGTRMGETDMFNTGYK